MEFEDRNEAGEKLAKLLADKFPDLYNNSSVFVLALPRGGLPVAAAIAKKLNASLDLIVTHKLGAPGNEEFAIGAVAEDGSRFLDRESLMDVSEDYLKEETRHQLEEIKKRIAKYRGGRPLPSLKKKIVILVDDGIATGNTIKAAITLAKNARAARIIVAVPVLPVDTLYTLRKMAETVYLDTPHPFLAIGRFYRNFEQLTDEAVRDYLAGFKR